MGNSDGATPMHVAVSDGSREIVMMLLEARADVDMFGGNGDAGQWGTPTFVAALAGHSEVLHALVDAKADVNAVLPVGFVPDPHLQRHCRDTQEICWDGLSPIEIARLHDREDCAALLQGR